MHKNDADWAVPIQICYIARRSSTSSNFNRYQQLRLSPSDYVVVQRMRELQFTCKGRHDNKRSRYQRFTGTAGRYRARGMESPRYREYSHEEFILVIVSIVFAAAGISAEPSALTLQLVEFIYTVLANIK